MFTLNIDMHGGMRLRPNTQSRFQFHRTGFYVSIPIILIAFGNRDVGCIFIFHALDMVAAIDMVDFTGNTAR